MIGTVKLEIYNLITVAEMWWDESLKWSAAIDGNKLFGRDRHEEGVEDEGCPLFKRMD